MESADSPQPVRVAAETIALDDAVRAVAAVVAAGEPSEANVTGDSTFDELGLSSLDFTEVLVTLEETVGRAVDVESITEDLVTVADLTKLRLVATE